MSDTFSKAFPELLKQLHVSVPAAQLSAALQPFDSADEKYVRENLRHLLYQLKIEGFKSILLPWERFNPNAGPALLFFKGKWLLLANKIDNDFEVRDSNGVKVEFSAKDWISVSVLWLRPRLSNLESDNNPPDSATKLLREMFKDNRRWFSEIVVASILVNMLAVLTSIYAMQVYDRVVPTFSYSTLTALTVGMLLVVCVDWVLKVMRARVLEIISKKIDIDLSQITFNHLLDLQSDKLPSSVGLVIAQLSSVESLRNFMSSTIIFSLVDLPFVLFFVFFVYLIGGSVAFVYLAAIPIAVIIGWYGKRKAEKLFKEELIRSTEKQGYLVEVIQGLDVVQATNSGWRFEGHWKELNEDISHFSVKNKRLVSFVSATAGSLSTLTYLGAIVVGVFQIEAGLLTMGGLIACSILGGRIIAPIAQGTQFIFQLQSVSQSLELASNLLELPTRKNTESRVAVLEGVPKSMSVDGVTYSYNNEPIVRLQIDKLRISAGDRIVLLGNIGSGKTTLLRHLAGIIPPQRGVIKLSNIDIWELAPEELTQHIGYFPQEVQLFKGTLRSNLNMANSANDEQVMELAQKLGISVFADSHPKKMEMPILEGGKGISIGQKQLIGVGRIMLSGPSVWLLDEPTASLDSETERKVLDALLERIKPADIVIISTHRKSFLKLANRVLVMHDGKVLADKSPSELFSTDNGFKATEL